MSKQFNVGDRVRVVRVTEWGGWMPPMKDNVGSTLRVAEATNENSNTMLSDGFYYPADALRRSHKAKQNAVAA